MYSKNYSKNYISLNEHELKICSYYKYSNETCKIFKKRAAALMALSNKDLARLSDEQISLTLECSRPFLSNLRSKYLEGGIESVFQLKRNENSNSANLKLDSRDEAILLSFACGPVPYPYARWTIDLLYKEFNNYMTSNGIDKKFSRTTIWRALDKNELKPHKSEYWCLPEITSEFVLRMENVLSIYALDYNPQEPVICMDECALQVLSDVRERLNVAPGCPELIDCEYERQGTKNIFLFMEPKLGKYYINVTEHRTSNDWAYQIKYLVDILYPNAQYITIVCDNLNTHLIQSLYKTFDPEDAKRISDRIRLVYTPKHGSWLNMAEIGINIMKRECIPHRFRSKEEGQALPDRVGEWQRIKNDNPVPIMWRFTTEKSRSEHKNLYDFTYPSSSSYKYVAINSFNLDSNISIFNRCQENARNVSDDNVIDLISNTDENGNVYWSIRLDENCVSITDPVGKNCVNSIVKKRNFSNFDGWAIPYPSIQNKNSDHPSKKYDFDFITFGENLVDLYNNRYDEHNPVVCMHKCSYDIENLSNNSWLLDFKEKKNETISKCVAHAQDIPVQNDQELNNKQGNSNNVDKNTTDKRIGVTFVIEPLTGYKYFRFSDYTDNQSIAETIKDLVDKRYQKADKINVVMNDADVDKLSSLEEVYSLDESLRLYNKLEIHPVSSSLGWLNFAEIESISVMRSCIVRRLTNLIDISARVVNWLLAKSTIKFNFSLKSFRKMFSGVYPTCAVPAEG